MSERTLVASMGWMGRQRYAIVIRLQEGQNEHLLLDIRDAMERAGYDEVAGADLVAYVQGESALVVKDRYSRPRRCPAEAVWLAISRRGLHTALV